MLELLKPFWIEIVKYGSIVMAIFVFWFKAKQSGKEIVERKEAMETLKKVRISDKIENNLNGLNDDKLDKLYNDKIKRG